MNWKQEAIDTLRSYPRRKQAITSLEEQINQLCAEAESVHSAASDGTPVSGGGNRWEDRILNNLVKRELLEQNRKATIRWCANVEKALATIHEDDCLVLDRMYIHRQRGHVERLCEELGVDGKTTVYRRADVALLRFVQAYYGCSEL